MNYSDYGYSDGKYDCANEYVLPGVAKALGIPQGRVLDLGCGNGAIARALLSLGHDIYGVDASVSGVAHANAATPGRFFVLDVNSGDLPVDLQGKPFDCVVSTEVIEHLYEPAALVRLARKSLNRGGKFILSTPYHGYLKNVVLAVTGKMDAHFTALWDGGHIKFFSRMTLTQLVESNGFRVTGFHGVGRLPFLWKSMILTAVAT